MPFLELALALPSNLQQRAEQALEDLGALAVTLADARADTPDESAIYEPGVGETPLWATLCMQALFAADVDRRGLLAALSELLPELAPELVEVREVPDQDWTRAWMDRYQPMRFGQRLWVYPWNIEPADLDADAVVLRMDPGLAFGSGTHATTALCLEWLQAQDLRGKTVLDYGCGSGILAIAALKLGAACAIGVDNDPQALIASRDNAARNDVAARLAVHAPEALPAPRCDVLVANILAAPLLQLAPRLLAALAPRAPFALSGVLVGQAEEVRAHYAALGAVGLEIMQREDWARISGRRG
jgi:ribosomal protein L11 methyltransferase